MSARRLRVVGFEPWDGGSHRAVRESIERHSRHDWQWITLPARAWKWRMRLAAIEMIDAAAAAGVLDEPADAIVATSLMSVADLRALMPAAWRLVPLVLYMHENQAAYPAGFTRPRWAERDAHFPLTNLTGILAADAVLWNSRWNLESFLGALADLLALSPDAPRAPADLATRIRDRSAVVWPPVEPPPPQYASPRGSRALRNPVRIVWPHRWEHDKGPGELFDLAVEHSERHDLRWIILGERFSDVPEELDRLRGVLGDRLEHIGYAPDRETYWRLLARADWVLSTARHEFFGIAVVEALLAGCLPWLPDRLSYPELLPEAARGLSPMTPPSGPGGAERVRAAIRRHLEPALAANAVARIDSAIEETHLAVHAGRGERVT